MMNIFNDDFRDFIQCLNKHLVEYILVGGYAVIIRGYSRSTGDMDIWVNKTETNYTNLQSAIIEFGLPAEAIKREQFFTTEFDVFSFGKPPYAIEIMTAVKGLDFTSTYELSTIERIDHQLDVRVIHLNQLIVAKKAAGRNKDLNDIENLSPNQK
jgi:predicted nucleotidyltransferase